jgi:hypothetical protein
MTSRSSAVDGPQFLWDNEPAGLYFRLTPEIGSNGARVTQAILVGSVSPALCDQGMQHLMVGDGRPTGLSLLDEAWPKVPEVIKAGILAMVKAARIG